MTNGVGTDLAGEVDLNCRVDGDDLRVLADDRRVVGPVAGIKCNEWIIVHEIKQSARAVDEAGDDSSDPDLLESVRHRARFNEVHDSIGKHFRVDPEIV